MTESERTHVQTKDIKLHPFYIYFTLLYKILTVFTYVYNWDNLENISLFGQFWKRCQRHNTTDPEYSVCIYNLSYLSSKIECHLHWLKFWPTCNAISIGSNFGHQVAIFAFVTSLATRWHHLHKLQIWPPDGATCISSKFCHHMAPLTLVANLATRWQHLH